MIFFIMIKNEFKLKLISEQLNVRKDDLKYY